MELIAIIFFMSLVAIVAYAVKELSAQLQTYEPAPKEKEPTTKKVDKLSILNQHKVASIVVEKFDKDTFNAIRGSLLYKEEITEAIHSLNVRLLPLYQSTYRLYFSIKAPEEKELDNLLEYGYRLITDKEPIKNILRDFEGNSSARTITPQALLQPVKKATTAMAQLSLSQTQGKGDHLLEWVQDDHLPFDFCDFILLGHHHEDVYSEIMIELGGVAPHLTNEEELSDAIYSCFEKVNKLTEIKIDAELKRRQLPIRKNRPMYQKILNFTLLFNVRRILQSKSGSLILKKVENTEQGKEIQHWSLRESSPKNSGAKSKGYESKVHKKSNEHIVVIAQTATEVAKDFDYTALLEILPVLSEHDEFKDAIDSIHKQLFPLYEKELKLKFDSGIDEHLEQCKTFGERMILDSKIIKEHQEKYFKSEKKEVHQKTDGARIIKKTHSWKELKDEF
jgi:hypothetical protein